MGSDRIRSREGDASSIAAMPEVLRWTNSRQALRQVHDGYVDRMAVALGRTLRRISVENPALGERLERSLSDLPNESFLRVLTSPETCSRLLWHRHGSVEEVSHFLEKSLLAEQARNGRPVVPGEEIWTALRDARVLPDGQVVAEPPLGDLIPLDFDSPQVSKIDLSGRQGRDHWPLDPDGRATTRLRLERALAGISATGEFLDAFVTLFIKILVLQRDREGTSYGSGSDQHHVGRVVITNPHGPKVEDFHLAESLVHEAVHALLYMQVQTSPWGLVDLPEDREPRVTSPWTGNDLALSAFLHACFVWYGLAQFWCLALSAGAFTAEGMTRRLARAAAGFVGPPLLDRLPGQSVNSVIPVIKESIGRMQASIRDAFGTASG